MTPRVRRRPVAGDVRAGGCAVVLVAFSVVFALAAVPALPGVGAVVFLVVGPAGTLLFTGLLIVKAGQVVGRRPVLELDDDGVRLPAPWSGTRDRVLPWPEVAAAVVWNRPVPRGRRGVDDVIAGVRERDLPVADTRTR